MIEDFRVFGYIGVEKVVGGDGNPFVVLCGYKVFLGCFAGREIDLALPAPPDFPRGVNASIHVRATPQLLPDGRVPDVRNVTASPLGAEWRYWSHNFGWSGERSTRELMAQVNRIFLDA